jgi:hypothetical protein
MSHLHKPLYFAALLAAFCAGLGELAMLQGWRLRDRMRRRRVPG